MLKRNYSRGIGPASVSTNILTGLMNTRRWCRCITRSCYALPKILLSGFAGKDRVDDHCE